MSCPGGEELAAYAAGELAALERRAVEAHLVRCRDCRARVLELRRAEARAAEDGGEAQPAPPADGERGFALGLVMALAVVALGLAALGRTFGGGSAAGVSPLGPSGAYGMLFDFVFFVRDRAPGVLELVVALAATASVAAIAALAVASLARRLGPRLAVALVVGAAAALPSHAFEVRGGHDAVVDIGSDEVVAGSLAASGEVVRIQGRVEGDLFVAAEHLVIDGVVDGNVFAWARVLDLRGRIGGSLHAACEELRIAGEIAGSSYSAAEVLSASAGARIGHDAFGFAHRADWQGAVARDLHFHGAELTLGGSVARDLLVASAGRVRIADGASVGRNLHAGVARESDLEVAAGAHIGGTRESVAPGPAAPSWPFDSWLWWLVRVASALAFGVALYALLPGLFRVRVPTLGSFVRLLGYGCAALVGVPLALALVALTLVGLPLAVLGAFLFATALYLAHVLAAVELGRAILRRSPAEELPSLGSFARILLVGLVAIAVALHVPVLGPAVRVVILLVGLGLVAERIQAFTRGHRPADRGTLRVGPAS